MKIINIEFKPMAFLFDEPVKVAFGTIPGYDTLAVKITTDTGLTGYGEAAPLGFVTGESLETCQAVGKDFVKALLGKDPLAIEEIHQIMDGMYYGNTSIKAGIDIACYDLAAKAMGVPLYAYLGGSTNAIESDVTIGIGDTDKMVQECLKWKDQGFTKLKIKLGEDVKTDLERIKAIRKAVGEDIELRIDANQGWNVNQAIEFARKAEDYSIQFLEQPLPYWDISGLKTVKDHSPIPVAADESCHSAMDAMRLVKEDAVDALNIKLMKCGGIYPALQINAIAQAAGKFCMIGCMGESRISNGAAMHLAAARKNISETDLDVTFYSHPQRGREVSGVFEREGGVCTFTDKPGIGVEIENF